MSELTEANGWIQDAGVQLMPVARSLTPMRPRMIFFHTNGNGVGTSTPTGMYASIQRQIVAGSSSVIIPTFEVGMSATAQFKSIFVTPSTQLNANPFSVGIETADSGAQNNPFGGIDHEPWNDYQLDMLARIAAFCARVGGVPLDRADAWNGHGCEGHCASNLIPGDRRGFTHPNVTTSTGKICPGHARLAQIPGILAAARALLGSQPAPAPSPIPLPPLEDNDVAYLLACDDRNARPEVDLVDGGRLHPIGSTDELNSCALLYGGLATRTLPVEHYDRVRDVLAR